MEQGWVKLYRKIEGNDLLWMDNNAYIVFTKLMLLVDRNGGWYRRATRSLAEDMYLSHSTMYRTLKKLETENLIRMEDKRHYTKFWIINWSTYQSNREIDTILEHNALQGVKQPVKRNLQSKTAIAETVSETQVKRTRNASETYNKNKELRNTHTRDAKKIVEHYNHVFGREVLLLDKRIAKIKLRFKNFTYLQIAQAIDNAAKDDFFNGGGGRGWVGDLDYLVKSDENVEKYLRQPTQKKAIF
jgi:DNA-binding PadR family transcriptional regulator